MIFVTVGTTRFDDLIREVDMTAESLDEKIIMQIGHGTYTPKNCEYFRFSPDISKYIRRSDLVIAHGGAGTTFEALHQGKKLIGVDNPDVNDSHQWDLLSELSQEGYMIWCRDPSAIGDSIRTAKKTSLRKYEPPPCSIHESISSYIRTRVLVIGGLPPPTGGMETVMQQMMDMELDGYELIPFNTAKTTLIKSNVIFNLFNFIYRCIKLLTMIAIYNPRIVHIHMTVNRDFWQKRVFMSLSRTAQRSIIIHMHAGRFKEFYETSKRRESIIRTLRSADGLVVLTEGWRRYYESIGANKNIMVIKNAIDPKITRYSGQKRKTKGLKLLFVGRVERQKGIYELLEAMHQLKDKDIHLTVMGQFMEEKETMDTVREYRIEDKTTFLGTIRGDGRFRHFADADVFVLPSYWEGLPVSMLEAMALGLAVIATRVGAIPEVVRKDNGILIEPKDVHSLTKAILKMYDRRKMIRIMSENNMRKIKDGFSIDGFRRGIIRAYEMTQETAETG